ATEEPRAPRHLQVERGGSTLDLDDGAARGFDLEVIRVHSLDVKLASAARLERALFGAGHRGAHHRAAARSERAELRGLDAHRNGPVASPQIGSALEPD